MTSDVNHSSIIETHPLPPFLPPNARVLMLGSFPPPRARWKMDFYYPNLQNDMWRIFGLVFHGRADYFLSDGGKGFNEAKLKDFLWHRGIALSDTAYRVERLRGNAADQFLRVVEETDLAKLLDAIPHCRTLVVTGEKAAVTLLRRAGTKTPPPAVGAFADWQFAGRALRLYRLPSSSRAYPLALADKAAVYRRCFAEMGLLANGSGSSIFQAT